MKKCIGFLHTSQVHVKTFADIAAQLAPEMDVIHSVEERLLAKTQESGLTRELIDEIKQSFAELTKRGADLVVCTCSSIGAVAEQADLSNAMRIDRAMADIAVSSAETIVVFAALESTLSPTQLLIEESAKQQQKQPKIQCVLIDEAWDRFCEEDFESYYQCIANAIKQHMGQCQAVVLAQASMAGAVAHCSHLDIPILTSPQLGVAAAVARLR